jgi:hypothetical protein
MNPKIIAVDFDGCLVKDAWPGIGAPIQSTIDALKAEQAAGCATILWTNRTGERLAEAVAWCEAQGIHLDYVNENTPGVIEFFGGDCRKVFANEYWDDRAVRVPERTCCVDYEKRYDNMGGVITAVICSACDCYHGFASNWGYNKFRYFCPGCGARIVKEVHYD